MNHEGDVCCMVVYWVINAFIACTECLTFYSRVHGSDNDLTDLDNRNRRDRDGESSKGKKKHKKHKKNKKSKKHEVDGKEKHSGKKHKKHHKRTKLSDDNTTDSNTGSGAAKTKSDAVNLSRRHDVQTKLQTTSTLNTKFTEIMKSNGHVVIAKAPPLIPKYNNGNGAAASKQDITGKIPTDPSKLVEFITKSLDPNTSTQVVSSASDSDTVRDVDSPDVAVIEEDDLNLEELMRQKALLQARLGGIVMSDTESENSRRTPQSLVKKMIIDDRNSIDKCKLKRIAEPTNDVILLDDSSNDASEKPSPPKKKVRNSRSKSKERPQKDRTGGNILRSRDNRDNDKLLLKNRRSDVENRFKEDLRKEIDRDKERNRSSPRRQGSSALKSGAYSPTAKSRLTMTEKTKTQTAASTSLTLREREVNKLNSMA